MWGQRVHGQPQRQRPPSSLPQQRGTPVSPLHEASRPGPRREPRMRKATRLPSHTLRPPDGATCTRPSGQRVAGLSPRLRRTQQCQDEERPWSSASAGLRGPPGRRLPPVTVPASAPRRRVAPRPGVYIISVSRTFVSLSSVWCAMRRTRVPTGSPPTRPAPRRPARHARQVQGWRLPGPGHADPGQTGPRPLLHTRPAGGAALPPRPTASRPECPRCRGLPSGSGVRVHSAHELEVTPQQNVETRKAWPSPLPHDPVGLPQCSGPHHSFTPFICSSRGQE